MRLIDYSLSLLTSKFCASRAVVIAECGLKDSTLCAFGFYFAPLRERLFHAKAQRRRRKAQRVEAVFQSAII
jgi:hypothetical protein